MIRPTFLLTAISLGLSACGPSEEAVKKLDSLVDKTKKELIFIKGGTFMMGNFCRLPDIDIVNYDSSKFTSCAGGGAPAHEVTLSDFHIMKHKVTFEDFDTYSEMNGNDKILPDYYGRHPKSIAGVSWQSARDYCHWLGGEMNLPLDLPTEAQWEYVARNNGEFRVYPTNNGRFDDGENVISYEQGKKQPPLGSPSYITGMTEPLPNGVYDLENGSSWMLDWYSPSYYKSSPKTDPVNLEKSPENKKSMRGPDLGSFTFLTDTTANRRYRVIDTNKKERLSHGFRCVQHQKPIIFPSSRG